MKMPTCQDVTELASDYLDGHMGWGDWAMMRMHLAMCPPCQAYVASLGLTIDALHTLSVAEQAEVQTDLARIFQQWKEDPESLPPVDLVDEGSPHGEPSDGA
jgi:anti-sigma factor RsiW